MRMVICLQKNYISQLLNVHNVSDVRQIEVHMAEPLVPGPSPFEAEIVVKLKKYKSPGCEILLPAIHKLINSVWIKCRFA
jgi:hypothetical protein